MRRCWTTSETSLKFYPEGRNAKDPSPLRVKDARVNGRRYQARGVICVNSKQARKDKADREAILKSLEEQLRGEAKELVGNQGYGRYLKSERDAFTINHKKVRQEERFDGKWVLTTNTGVSVERRL